MSLNIGWLFRKRKTETINRGGGLSGPKSGGGEAEAGSRDEWGGRCV